MELMRSLLGASAAREEVDCVRASADNLPSLPGGRRMFRPIALLIASMWLATSVAATAASVEQPAEHAPVLATMAKRGNVRFGPNLKAPTVTTLSAGATVEILGEAQGADGWYTVRFPREGHAWMHDKVLQPIEDGKRFKVMVDRANVRDDATNGGNIVAMLNVGDIVEFQGQKIGDWNAIYPPQAIAYVHQSMLDMAEQRGKELGAQARRQKYAEALWQTAQETYARYSQASVKQAMSLDWQGLSAQMKQVAAEHPSQRVQLDARKYSDGIDKVLAVQKERGGKATESVPQPAPIPEEPVPPRIVRKDPPVKIDPPNKTDPPTKVDPPVQVEPPVKVDPPTKVDPAPEQPNDSEVQNIIGDDTGKPKMSPSQGGATVEGWLEQRDYSQVGTGHVLIDSSSNVAAFVKVREGANIQLSEYFWRWVEVKGSRHSVDQSLHDLGRDVPLIIVDEVTLLGR
jgi:hypothetical protein